MASTINLAVHTNPDGSTFYETGSNDNYGLCVRSRRSGLEEVSTVRCSGWVSDQYAIFLSDFDSHGCPIRYRGRITIAFLMSSPVNHKISFDSAPTFVDLKNS